MFKPLRKEQMLMKIFNNAFIDMPIPKNINNFWNFGSLLGLCFVIQFITGIMLAMHYVSTVDMAFNSLMYICRDVNWGWILRIVHMNGASFFFICLYIHIGRGMYYSSYLFLHTWSVGVLILFLSMATAFVGYVLPWGQMSFWGATVITNLISAIPYIGIDLVQWLWGGFSVDNATLNRFFSFHFLFPFIIVAFSLIHIMFLHQSGSNNPLGISSNFFKTKFHPYFSFKDIKGFIMLMLGLLMVSMLYPNLLGDFDNYIPANPLISPPHIQPEWYFLFAYAILRSIPNKLGGVLALVMSIMILFIMPFIHLGMMRSRSMYFLNKVLFWFMINIIILLTWIGARSVEDPYIIMGQVLTLLYFMYFMMDSMLMKFCDKL